MSYSEQGNNKKKLERMCTFLLRKKYKKQPERERGYKTVHKKTIKTRLNLCFVSLKQRMWAFNSDK